MRYMQTLQSDEGAAFDREIRLDAAKLPPIVTWGTSPEQVASITGHVPRLDEVTDEHKREMLTRALSYMGLQGGEKITDIARSEERRVGEEGGAGGAPETERDMSDDRCVD